MTTSHGQILGADFLTSCPPLSDPGTILSVRLTGGPCGSAPPVRGREAPPNVAVHPTEGRVQWLVIRLFQGGAPLAKLTFEVRMQKGGFWKAHITANLQQEFASERG